MEFSVVALSTVKGILGTEEIKQKRKERLKLLCLRILFNAKISASKYYSVLNLYQLQVVKRADENVSLGNE